MLSPRGISRLAGVFYIMDAAFGPAMIALRKIVVINDAAATANNLAVHRTLLEVGFAGNMIAVATYIAVIALLYHLFRPVNKLAALNAAFFGLVGCTIIAAGNVLYLAPLVSPPSAALLLFKLYSQAFNISFVFFGLYCTLIGYLCIKSGFVPKLIGAGMMLAGTAWLIFLFPVMAHAIAPYILVFGIGELAFTLWLTFVGVDSATWNQVAASARS